MSTNYQISIWSVHTFSLVHSFTAYHNFRAHFYLDPPTESQLLDDFDVSTLAVSDSSTLLVSGLYNGTI